MVSNLKGFKLRFRIINYLILHSQLILTSIKKYFRESAVIPTEEADDSLRREALGHCVGVAQKAWVLDSYLVVAVATMQHAAACYVIYRRQALSVPYVTGFDVFIHNKKHIEKNNCTEKIA